MRNKQDRLDIHATITNKIIAAIEAGVDEWQMPWHRPGTNFTIPKNALTQQPYRGINILSLWIDADAKKFEHQIYATYGQWAQLGAQVRAGEKASLIVKYGTWTPKSADREPAPQDNADDPQQRTYAKPAWVFNIAQVDGAEVPSSVPRKDLTERLAHVDAFIANTRAEFRYGGQRAFYRRLSSAGTGDYIRIPDREMFIGTETSTPTETFEATRLHELSHWTSAASRLDRDLGKRFADDAYSAEELCAEISAAALCCQLEISNTPRPDHAQYIAHWLKIMRGDARAIFTAAAHASRVAEYLFGLQPQRDDADHVA